MKALAALLLLAVLGVLFISVNAQLAVNDDLCCTKHFDKLIPAKKVVSYIRTSSRCPLKAIVLYTELGKPFCVNPDLHWVKKIVKKLD